MSGARIAAHVITAQMMLAVIVWLLFAARRLSLWVVVPLVAGAFVYLVLDVETLRSDGHRPVWARWAERATFACAVVGLVATFAVPAHHRAPTPPQPVAPIVQAMR